MTFIYKTVSTFAPTTASAAMNSEVEEPPQKKKKTTFSSLPEEIVVSCLARISKSYYPKLCLVSKSFCSIISSFELHHARYHLEKMENVLYVCLQLPDRLLPSWFSLWIKPDQILTNDIMEKDNNNKSSSTGNTLLVRVPSSYSPCEPMIIRNVGSKTYALVQYDSSISMCVRKDGTYNEWSKAPSMTVARENAVAGILDGKIYVMGGCKADESANWAEVFDTKTETWESLPDPGAELRFSSLKSMRMTKGKVYVENSEKKCYVYDPKEGRWDVEANAPVGGRMVCKVENVRVRYSRSRRGFFWYDKKHKDWRVVKGLEAFDRYVRDGVIITLASYCGKLLILLDKFEQPGGQCQNKNIWCSVIKLERRNGDDEVWGNVEWASVVVTVPSSYAFLRCQVRSV